MIMLPLYLPVLSELHAELCGGQTPRVDAAQMTAVAPGQQQLVEGKFPCVDTCACVSLPIADCCPFSPVCIAANVTISHLPDALAEKQAEINDLRSRLNNAERQLATERSRQSTSPSV